MNEEWTMSDAARWMIAIAFISLPTIAFGGYFLLSILRRQAGTEKITAEQASYFRAGHAHAGVLVTLGIIGQLVLDQSRMGDGLVWTTRIALIVAPLLISGGFFGGAPRTAGGPAAPLIRLAPNVAVLFSLATLGVGVGLIMPE
jgi:hypothetical protein